MPIYEFVCHVCENTFETLRKISEMKAPISEPCPTCSNQGAIEQLATAASIGDPIRYGHKRPDAGWNEVLSRIKTAHPRGNWSNSRFSSTRTV